MSKLRQEYLLCYDIGETKKRHRLFERLKDYGMIPVQKSVFWGDINIAEKRTIERLIKDTVTDEGDKVLFFAVEAFHKTTFMQGHQPEEFVEKKFGII